jgi:ribonucleotide monophosphatase NagD (HAD superfamily)
MKPVAFFDIDGTVFRSSLLIELVEQLIKEESISS